MTEKKKFDSTDLFNLSKDDLVDRIRQLEFHVNQLKNVIAKGNGEKQTKKQYQSRPFDFSKHNKRHVLLRISYLGWNYKGFVVQEDTNETIENALFDALIRTRLIESRETSNYHRCGRTDKGVSAFGQVISIDLRSTQADGIGIIKVHDVPLKSEEINYIELLNRVLPPEIRVVAWAPVSEDFSARFDCLQRKYKYFFPKGDLDVFLMNEGAAKLVGSHDFRNLCKMDVGNGVENFMRTIDSAKVVIEETDDDGFTMCTFIVESKAFLWHQIRCIVAILVMIGKGWESPKIIDELFDIERNPCKPQYAMASELPLNLYDCEYEGIVWIYPTDSIDWLISHLQSQWTEHNIRATMIRNIINSLQPHTNTEISHQADKLLPDYKRSAKHRPLMTRVTCSSLEDRQEYFSKRRRLNKALKTGEHSDPKQSEVKQPENIDSKREIL